MNTMVEDYIQLKTIVSKTKTQQNKRVELSKLMAETNKKIRVIDTQIKSNKENIQKQFNLTKIETEELINDDSGNIYKRMGKKIATDWSNSFLEIKKEKPDKIMTKEEEETEEKEIEELSQYLV